jgi:hypothetical protein
MNRTLLFDATLRYMSTRGERNKTRKVATRIKKFLYLIADNTFILYDTIF